MPNFTQTKINLLSAKSSVDTIKSIIEGSRPLGNGFSIEVNIIKKSGQLEIEIEFKGNTDIRRIPTQTIIKYAKALKLINDWTNDSSPDFPDLTKL